MGNWQSSLRWIFNVVTTIIKSSLRYTRSLFDTLCGSAQDIQLRIESILRWIFSIVITIVSPNLTPPISLDKLPNATVSLDNWATVCRFRLVDCNAFLDSRTLSIIEYPNFPPNNITYAAISYPWRDLQMPQGVTPPEGSFRVHGAEKADEISIDVLRTACVAARRYGASLLWLDRLCLLQTNKIDKAWQIQRMYQIYKLCNPCLVFPGGLVRLANLSEPTTWIYRAWTLQEVVANLKRNTVKCVFSFTHSSFSEFVRALPDRGYSPKFITYLCNDKTLQQPTLEPGHSGICDLSDLCTSLSFKLEYFERVLLQNPDDFPLRILPVPASRLFGACIVFDDLVQYQPLWRSVFTRTSSRPVDMVLSIMGPMEVDLPVADFDKDDRLKATIKLIQALMKRGLRANWLFIAPELPPSAELSTLPAFPETSEGGRAMIRIPGPELVLAVDVIGEPWRTDNAPYGVMSDQGYFKFHARGAFVVGRGRNVTNSKTNTYFECAAADEIAGGSKEVWAVVIGHHDELNRNPETGQIASSKHGKRFPEIVELTLMFVEKHGSEDKQDLYHRVGVEREIEQSKTSEWDWTDGEFSVGGPGRGKRVRFAVSPRGPVYC
ncbi:hypothetical protein WOLCODRAFT_141610 [Wolfiporia cocos MD-104 SS10]|uniref:Heterokaryon incompatibility domain-containing protein n=1 Tax=Wolfiporia cocos (strain MD-104) TaxID=742152 RepID=A0A2H3J0P3_WOLCO|nr:hypothetical protein WOLCODRAFT_141610 [Wolfiporia cocos MD-104 SS10]